MLVTTVPVPETKCPGLQAARPLSVPHLGSPRLRNFVNNLCVAYGEKEGRVPLETRSLSLPASRKGRDNGSGDSRWLGNAALLPTAAHAPEVPQTSQDIDQDQPTAERGLSPTSWVPFLNEVWRRYEAVPPRPAPPQRAEPG